MECQLKLVALQMARRRTNEMPLTSKRDSTLKILQTELKIKERIRMERSKKVEGERQNALKKG